VAAQNLSLSSNNMPLGGSITVDFDMANVGQSDTYSGKFYADVNYYVYVDTDTNLDNGATQLTWGYTHETIAPGGHVPAHEVVTLNYSVIKDQNPRYIIVKLAPYGECDGCGTNNIAVSAPVTIYQQVDFGISKLMPEQSTLTLGKPFKVELGVVNNGLSQAFGYVSNALYLSDDEAWDGNDRLLNAWSSYAIDAGANSAHNAVNVTLSQSSVQPGQKFLIAVADYVNGFTESNGQGSAENNNVAVLPVAVVAPDFDLVMNDIVVTQSGAPISPDAFDGVSNLPVGGFINVATSTANEGLTQIPGPSGPQVKLYLSTDTQIDAGDVQLDLWVESSLNPQTASTHNTPMQLDPALTPGRYYLIAVIDPNNQYAENNAYGTAETNNIGMVSLDVIAPVPDLVVTQVQTASTVLPIGSGFTFSSNVLNQGVTATSNSFNVGVYLSEDTNITTGDRLLSFRNINGLLAGEQSGAESYAAIPTTVPMGCYYLGAIVDYSERVAESCSGCEANNALSGTLISVGGAACGSTPAPTVTLSANPLSITAGETTTLSWTSTDATQCNASATGDSSGWSGTKPLNGNQVLSPAQTTTYVLTCSGPGGSSSGEPVEVTVTVPAPVVSLSVTPSTIEIGQSATLTWSASNANSCSATATGDATGWNGSKASSGSQTVSPTATTTYELSCSGAGGTGSAVPQLLTVTIPVPTVDLSASPVDIDLGGSATLTWGSTDANSCTASVQNGGDNTGWNGAKATSGFQVVSPTTTTTYNLSCEGGGGTGSAQPVTVTVTVPTPVVTISANPTTIDVGQSTLLSWSSSNADSCAASVSPGGDATGWSGTKATADTQTLTPSVTTTYLLECSGSGGSSSASAAVTVNDPGQLFVDIAMQAGLSSPSGAVTGSTISLSGGVQNIGNDTTNYSVNVYFYLSTDQIYDTQDRYLGSINNGYLSAGQSKSFTQSVTIPANLTPGSYYLLAIADRNNYVVEQDDPDNLNGNNKAVGNAIAITVGADVVMQSISGPTSSFTGAAIDLNGSVQNVGSGQTSYYVYVYYYLSADQTYDAQDRYLGQINNGYLSGGQSKSFSQSVTIPTNLPPGRYYLLAVADRNNYVSEQDDPDNLNGNNKAVGNAISITVGADVAMQTISGPTDSFTGASIDLSGSVQNVGSGRTSYYVYVDYYLSTDQAYDSQDRYLGRINAGYLSAAQSQDFTQSVKIPANLTPGSYYLLAVADSNNYVLEQDDPDNLNGNNKAVGNAISISVGADVAMASISGPSSAVAGSSISLNGSVKNVGSGETSYYTYVQYYLSTDQTYDSQDRYLGQINNGYLVAGENKSFSQSVTVPANLTPGDYYLLAIADRNNYVIEQDDPDNLNANNKAVGNIVTVSAP
jgi:subtilase family serine protease